MRAVLECQRRWVLRPSWGPREEMGLAAEGQGEWRRPAAGHSDGRREIMPTRAGCHAPFQLGEAGAGTHAGCIIEEPGIRVKCAPQVAGTPKGVRVAPGARGPGTAPTLRGCVRSRSAAVCATSRAAR